MPARLFAQRGRGWLCAVTTLTLACTQAPPPEPASVAARPIPWVWESHGRIPSGATQAAILSETIHLSGDAVRSWPRGFKVQVAADVAITPVVHVEVSRVNPPAGLRAASAEITQALQRAAGRSTSGWVQLDLEAPLRLRTQYLELVQSSRAALPANVRLSVTALAWWCTGGGWLDSLAADEVVPMFFRMGKDGAVLRELQTNSPHKLHAKCRAGAIGTAHQEPFAASTTARFAKHYQFDYRAKPPT